MQVQTLVVLFPLGEITASDLLEHPCNIQAAVSEVLLDGVTHGRLHLHVNEDRCLQSLLPQHHRQGRYSASTLQGHCCDDGLGVGMTGNTVRHSTGPAFQQYSQIQENSGPCWRAHRFDVVPRDFVPLQELCLAPPEVLPRLLLVL